VLGAVNSTGEPGPVPGVLPFELDLSGQHLKLGSCVRGTVAVLLALVKQMHEVRCTLICAPQSTNRFLNNHTWHAQS
jgi:hypothetical protein